MPITIPKTPVVVKKPSEFASEHDKFKDNGQWFLDYARWIVLNYYNTYGTNESYIQPLGNTGIVTASGTQAGTYASQRIVDEMLDNYRYFFGNQDNRIFNHLTTGMKGNALPNVWIKGQEIFQLGQHIVGKGQQIIQPIEDNISCETISEHTLLKRQEIFDKIDVAAQIGDMLAEVSGGTVRYQPAGDIDYSDPKAVKEAKDKIRKEYENTATVLTRNAYYTNHLAEKFLNTVQDTTICGLTGIEFTEEGGRLVSNYIPGYQGIFDFSTWGEYGDRQTLGGYIVPMKIEDALSQYSDMPDTMRGEIEDIMNGIDGSNSFMDYWNQPFQNVLWWYNDQKWISKATVYWIGECNLPYQKKTNKFGGKKVKKIDAYKDYQVANGDKYETKKGYELKGDTKVWKVHKAVILGNKYLVEYGYDTYQVRPFGEKEKPILPIHFFCQGKIAGYVKPIVSRLKPKQDELDAVRYRIRELVANDLGYNIMVNGAKLTETLTPLDIANDFRTYHVSVITSTGDEVDKTGIGDLVKEFQSQAMVYINQYLVLKNDLMKEMQDAINLPDISLGTQVSITGKGVQQQTIAQSELSSLPFFNSLLTYWQKILTYAANKNKMILLDGEKKNVVLPISTRETKLLKLTKEFRFEDLNVYISPNDAIAQQELELFRQMLQAYAQNPSTSHAEAIANALKMMRSKSFGEAISLFENFVIEKKKEEEQMQLRAVEVEQANMQVENTAIQQRELQAQMAQLMTKLTEIQAKGSWSVKEAEVKAGLDRQFQYDDAIISQIAGLVGQQLQGMGQPAAPQGQ